MKVFSKEKYDEWSKARGMKGYPWAEECDGNAVTKDALGRGRVFGNDGLYYICNDAWCIEVPDKKPKVTMEQFVKDRIAIRTGTGENAKKFLKMCEKQGLQWNSGRKATEHVPNMYENDCCIVCGYTKEKRLEYAHASYCYGKGWVVVDFADIEYATQDMPKDYDILISCHDGKATTATLIVDGTAVKTARADCHPADKFKLKTGAEHVLERLFAKKPKKTKA